MSGIVMRAPLLKSVLSSNADTSTEAISVSFLATDEKKYQLDISLACTPLLIAALVTEAGKLASSYPPEKTPVFQGIRASGVQLAMKDDGTVAILLRLESGLELPLEFDQRNLSRLRQLIDEAERMIKRNRHH